LSNPTPLSCAKKCAGVDGHDNPEFQFKNLLYGVFATLERVCAIWAASRNQPIQSAANGIEWATKTCSIVFTGTWQQAQK
jgi:hypothetical protein